MIVGVDVDESRKENAIIIYNFFSQVNDRLRNDSWVKNPFSGTVHVFEKSFYIVNLKPIYVNIAPLLYALAFGGWFFEFHKFSIIMLIFGLLSSFIFSKYFVYIILYFGLRKAKYGDYIRLVSNEEIIRRLLSNDTGRCI